MASWNRFKNKLVTDWKVDEELVRMLFFTRLRPICVTLSLSSDGKYGLLPFFFHYGLLRL